jgi:Tfp pilus assembly protein PilN
MIRINLLPIKEKERSEASKRQLILFVCLILVELVVLYFVYGNKSGELDKLTTENNIKSAAIEDLKKQVADVEKLTKEKSLLEEQIGVLDTLAGRAGPVKVLDDVQLILSPPRDEYEKLRRSQDDGWNVKWDTDRLWFNSFQENKGNFGLSGGARSNDDVAEFLQRLSASNYFENVRLVSVSQQDGTDFDFVTFEVLGRINYDPGGKAPADPKAVKPGKGG